VVVQSNVIEPAVDVGGDRQDRSKACLAECHLDQLPRLRVVIHNQDPDDVEFRQRALGRRLANRCRSSVAHRLRSNHGHSTRGAHPLENIFATQSVARGG
jgi:hypothetical protein